MLALARCSSTYSGRAAPGFQSIPAITLLAKQATYFFGAPYTAAAFRSVLAALFAALLAPAIQIDEGFFARFTKFKALRFLGGGSYGICVFRIPILVGLWTFMGRFSWCHAFQANLYCVLIFPVGNVVPTLATSMASIHLYEKHFLKLKKYFPERAAAATPITTDH